MSPEFCFRLGVRIPDVGKARAAIFDAGGPWLHEPDVLTLSHQSLDIRVPHGARREGFTALLAAVRAAGVLAQEDQPCWVSVPLECHMAVILTVMRILEQVNPNDEARVQAYTEMDPACSLAEITCNGIIDFGCFRSTLDEARALSYVDSSLDIVKSARERRLRPELGARLKSLTGI